MKSSRWRIVKPSQPAMARCPCGADYAISAIESLPKRLKCGHTFCFACVSRASKDGKCVCSLDDTVTESVPLGIATNMTILQSILSAAGTTASKALYCPYHDLDVSRAAAVVCTSDGNALCRDCATVYETKHGSKSLLPIELCGASLKNDIVQLIPAVKAHGFGIKDQSKRLGQLADSYGDAIGAVTARLDDMFAEAVEALRKLKSDLTTRLHAVTEEGQQVNKRAVQC